MTNDCTYRFNSRKGKENILMFKMYEYTTLTHNISYNTVYPTHNFQNLS